MKIKKMLRCLIMLTIVVGVSSMAFGADPNWIGAVSNDWHIAGNWSTLAVPFTLDDAEIGGPGYPGTYPITVDIAADANALYLDIGTGTNALDVTTVNLNSGLLTVGEDLLIGMGGDVGKVTFIADSNSLIGDELKVGNSAGSDGTLVATDVYLDVAGAIRIGKGGTGTVTLNSTDITKFDGSADASKLRVGYRNGGNGTLIMNGTSVIRTNESDTYIGSEENSSDICEGTVELNGTSAIYIGNNKDLRVAGKGGKGTIEMNDDSYIFIDKDLFVGARNNGDGIITMTGGTIDVDNKVYMGTRDAYYDYGDDNRCRLTMSGYATINTGSNGTFRFGVEDDPTPLTPNELTMSGNALIDVDVMKIATSVDAYADVDISGDAQIKCSELQIGKGGGGCDFNLTGVDIDDELNLDIRLHLLVASDTATSYDPVNIVIDDNAEIFIGDGTGDGDIKIGGSGAQVTVEFKDGKIYSTDGLGQFQMPDNGPSTGSGYSHFILGEDDITKNKEDAEFVLDGYLVGDDATVDKDYIDFLAGGILKVKQGKVPEQDIKDHIVSGYFRTTYSQATLYGDAAPAPADPNCFRPVYSSEDGGNRWDVQLGIGPKCVDSVGDLTGDCEVDVDDLAALALGWITSYDMEDLADVSRNWDRGCMMAYDYTCP